MLDDGHGMYKSCSGALHGKIADSRLVYQARLMVCKRLTAEVWLMSLTGTYLGFHFGSVCVCLYVCKMKISVTLMFVALFCLGTPLWYSLLCTASLYVHVCCRALYVGLHCYALQEVHGTLLYQST